MWNGIGCSIFLDFCMKFGFYDLKNLSNQRSQPTWKSGKSRN